MSPSSWAASSAKALRTARLAAQLTQDELAQRIGVHVTTIQRIEAGQPPQPSIADAWARHCNVKFVLTVEPMCLCP